MKGPVYCSVGRVGERKLSNERIHIKDPRLRSDTRSATSRKATAPFFRSNSNRPYLDLIGESGIDPVTSLVEEAGALGRGRSGGAYSNLIHLRPRSFISSIGLSQPKDPPKRFPYLKESSAPSPAGGGGAFSTERCTRGGSMKRFPSLSNKPPGLGLGPPFVGSGIEVGVPLPP